MKLNKIEHTFSSMKSETSDEHVLIISGAIGEGGYFYEGTSATDVRKALENVEAKTIRIKLNSPGGNAFDGLEIYNYLKDLDAHVIVEVTALAASAASIIAMGADEVIMRTGFTMMIHNASTITYGNKDEMLKVHEYLAKIDTSIIDVYKEKTGLSTDEIKEMLNNETWFTASEAVEKGFADSYETQTKEEKEITSYLNSNYSISQKIDVENEIKEIKTQISELQNQSDKNQEVKDKSVNDNRLKSLLF